jgi:uncharacterized protein YndB with AHSA1/START domain
MQKEIKHTWFFSQSPQEVWEYLTKPELLEQWLMKTDFQPIVGHKFRFICNNICYCEVLEVKPFTTLSYSWQANSAHSNKPFNSKVVWTLIPKENGTELQLVHNGFTVLEDYIGHNNGWTTLGNRFIELLNTIKK